jgi:hypothetical protein
MTDPTQARPARDVKPGDRWTFDDHKTCAEWGPSVEKLDAAAIDAAARAICLRDCKRFEIGLPACNPGVAGTCRANDAQLWALKEKARAAIDAYAAVCRAAGARP